MNQAALAAKFRKVILANELDDNIALALTFSDPDGVRSGKSGWSFGVCQYDIANNSAAATCLRACNFTVDEIAGLKAQTVDVRALEPKLKAAASTIEKFDQIQLTGCLVRAQAILFRRGIDVADDTALLAIADYANQYYLSDIDKPGYLVHYLIALGRPFTAKDVLDFKLACTPYGKTHPGDCKRRYTNLLKVMAE
jgi:hypothetical protein